MHELSSMTVDVDLTRTPSWVIVVIVVIYVARRVDLRLRIR